MNGMYITFIIFLNGLLPLFICKCDSDVINIYLSKQNVTGSTDDLTGTCNVTGLSRNEIVLTDTCTSSPVLAWIGAYAKYSPWIEYKGCGMFNFTANLIEIDFTQKNFSTEPDIFKCFEHCQMYHMHNYIGFQRNKCLCFFSVDIEDIVQCNNTTITVCGDNQNFICGNKDNVTVVYEIKNQIILPKNDTGQCGIVQIHDNQTTFSSKECSNKAAVLCFDNDTLKVFPNKAENWRTAVQFCQTQNWLISSVANVMGGYLLNITDGTYWVSAIRGVSYTSLQEQDRMVSSVEDVMNGNLLNVTDGSYWVFTTSRIAVQATIDNDFCVASLIENGKKMTPIVKSCDVKLPVTCRIGSSDPWNGTSRECITSGHDITSTNSYITTNMANVSVQTQSLMERNLIIIIISGSIGFIVLVVIVIILICKRRKRTMKTENVKSNSQETKDYAEVLPDVEYKNNSDTINIYDHTDTFQTSSKLDTNLQSEYDSMAGIKQEAEGLYDESATCPSGNTQTKELEDGLNRQVTEMPGDEHKSAEASGGKLETKEPQLDELLITLNKMTHVMEINTKRGNSASNIAMDTFSGHPSEDAKQWLENLDLDCF
ncbi:unnamed protein product [Mytilus edulis]|uniref:Uncharacterized protein n=1 Tax=Mytilus edulis TaxID=6550 RepID=A0A8S3TR71_MYTED|nr:unnamed protein product [Mytilus edulis]